MVDERIAERRATVRAQRRRARLRRTLLVVLLSGVAGGAVWLEQSEHLAVRDVVVLGTVRLGPEEVVEASSIEVGAGIVRMLPGRIARRVETVPLVRSATVSRTGLREVTVTVVEREPVYTATSRALSVLVDRDGVVVQQGSDALLPTVRLVTIPPAPGELVVAHEALANAHRVWTGLSGPLRSRVVRMDAPDLDGLVLILDEGPEVLFGRAERIEEKVRAMGIVLDDVAGSEVTVIDVRVPDVPVVRSD